MAEGQPDNPKRLPSIVDVAKEAGVSRMTVSRVLRSERYVKPETAQKVHEAVKRIGYRKNPMVQTLMTSVRRRQVQLKSNIAWLDQKRRNADRFHRLLVGVRERAEALGFGFEQIMIDPETTNAKRIDSILRARGVNGVVLAPLTKPGTSYDFPWSQYAISTIGRSIVSPRLNYVMMHHLHAMETALAKMKDRGYKRIAFFSTRDTILRTEATQLMAYLLHNHYQPPENRLEPLYVNELTDEELLAWYTQHQPDAVLSYTPVVVDRLKAIGLRAPQDIGFAALTRIDDYPSVSCVKVPAESMGAVAVDMVVAQIYRNEYGLPVRPRTIMIEGEWIEGNTLCPR